MVPERGGDDEARVALVLVAVGVDPEPYDVRHVPSVDVGVPHTGGGFAVGGAVAAIAEDNTAACDGLVGRGDGAQRGEHGAEPKRVPVRVRGPVDSGVAEALVLGDGARLRGSV